MVGPIKNEKYFHRALTFQYLPWNMNLRIIKCFLPARWDVPPHADYQMEECIIAALDKVELCPILKRGSEDLRGQPIFSFVCVCVCMCVCVCVWRWEKVSGGLFSAFFSIFHFCNIKWGKFWNNSWVLAIFRPFISRASTVVQLTHVGGAFNMMTVSPEEWTWERWQWKGTLYSLKLQHYRSFTIRLFNVISRTLIREVLLRSRDAAGTYYRPKPPGLVIFSVGYLLTNVM